MEDFQQGLNNLWESVPKNGDDFKARIEELEVKLQEFETLGKIEEATGVKRLYIFAAAA